MTPAQFNGTEPWVFTPEVMETIKKMRANGISARVIAATIGTTRESLQATLCQKGFTAPLVTRLLNDEVKRIYLAEAKRRRMRPGQLTKLLLTTIAKDNLFTAVLDDGK